mgnify:CR=1 FL=1
MKYPQGETGMTKRVTSDFSDNPYTYILINNIFHRELRVYFTTNDFNISLIIFLSGSLV